LIWMQDMNVSKLTKHIPATDRNQSCSIAEDNETSALEQCFKIHESATVVFRKRTLVTQNIVVANKHQDPHTAPMLTVSSTYVS